jgi:GAF domain-containing protein
LNPVVLVLEKDRGTRKLLEALLGRLGLEVDAVASSAGALLLLAQVDYDFAFATAEVLGWIEAHRPELLARSIVLSSASPAQLAELRARWPAVRTIRKPFDLSDVITLAQSVAADHPRRSGSATETFARRSIIAGAKSGVVMSLTGAGITPVTDYGYAPGVVESFLPFAPDSPMPICVAIRHARPVWIASSRMAGEFSEFMPVWEQFATGAVAAVPVIHDGVVLGAAGWTFREPQRFDEAQQATLVAIAAALSDVLGQSGERSTA